ncbi:16S rRNA (guanine(966)-N(2))-methyltransferase RsmD [bacterium]|nr:16S rRNA (guanine(966)-N(2))-methyltransferase RsmD [bacterium]
MRIIAGELRGRKIEAPRGSSVRPTYDRVRESLFATIDGRLLDARVLDLFAGTGSLGIESLSRGARSAVFVERDPGVVAHLRRTIERLEITDRCQVFRSDAIRFVSSRRSVQDPFDIVFADPPYDSDLARRVYEGLNRWEGMLPGGLAVIEHRAGDRLPERGDRLAAWTTKRYGMIEVELHDVVRAARGVGQESSKEDS